MFLATFLTSLLGQTDIYTHNPIHEYKINDSLSYDYILSYESNMNDGSPNLRFSTGFQEEYIINTIEDTNHNETICELACNDEALCQGFITYHNEFNNCNCNLLSNLGEMASADGMTMSYKRIEIHHPPIDEFVIMGIAISPQSDIRNVTVFIDLNLNGVFDPGEPYNYTYEEYYFDFYIGLVLIP